MALSDADLAAIDAMFARADSAIPADFRQRFPALSLTRCDASDLDDATPFRVFPSQNLFLVDSSDHCWRITQDPARATGIVVARRNEAA